MRSAPPGGCFYRNPVGHLWVPSSSQRPSNATTCSPSCRSPRLRKGPGKCRAPTATPPVFLAFTNHWALHACEGYLWAQTSTHKPQRSPLGMCTSPLVTLGQVAQKCHLGMNRHFFLFLYVRLFPMAIIPSRGAIRSAFAQENLPGIQKPRIRPGALSVA